METGQSVVHKLNPAQFIWGLLAESLLFFYLQVTLPWHYFPLYFTHLFIYHCHISTLFFLAPWTIWVSLEVFGGKFQTKPCLTAQEKSTEHHMKSNEVNLWFLSISTFPVCLLLWFGRTQWADLANFSLGKILWKNYL